jgi:two-component system, sensor histidine kinase and response regulator
MENLHNFNNRPTVLVVDDVPDNLSLMGSLLKGDYRVKVANSGEKALRIARSDTPPDLILLDIMMPGMDGYEVCRQLKADAATKDIPVIFLTAKTDVEDEQQGLELGAVDYITKPVSPPITMARVRNHLELKRHRDHLSALVAQRTRELEEACNRLKVLDAASQDYLRTISHELRTPASGVLGIGQLALDEITDEALRTEYQSFFSASRERLMSAIDAALQLAELQSGSVSIATVPIDLTEIIATIWTSLQESWFAKGLSLVFPHTEPVLILGNEELLRQSVTTLLKAAERMATPGTAVTLQFSEEEAQQTLRIVFQGPHLSDELQESFFHTFSYDRSSSCVEDLGLALPLAAEIVRAMGGAIDFRKTASGAEIALTLRKDSRTIQRPGSNP